MDGFEKHPRIVYNSEFEHFKLWEYSCHKLERLITEVNKVHKKKYKRSRKKKYGNLSRAFTDEELNLYIRCCRNEKAVLSAKIQSGLGLRIGEVVNVRLCDIDFKRDKIKIYTEKANTIDILPLYPAIKIILLEWFYKHERNIKSHDGYLLFSSNKYKNSKYNNRISPNWLRNYFRKTCVLAGLDEDYGYSDESQHKHKRPRKLYRLTTHSFRHYFGTKLANSGVPIHIIQRLMRHQSLNSTKVYLNTTPSDMEKAVNNTFAMSNFPHLHNTNLSKKRYPHSRDTEDKHIQDILNYSGGK